MKRPSVIVVGSANTDLVSRVSRLPQPGETVIGSEFRIFAGGKGANQAVAASRAGARTTFIASIGSDHFGDATLEGLRGEKIDTRYVVRSKRTPSGVALIMVDTRGENMISVARGSNGELLPRHIDAALSAIRSGRCLLVQLEIPLATVRRVAELAARSQVPVVLNPAPAQPVTAALLQQVACLTPNEHELGVLTDSPVKSKPEIEAAATKLRAAGVQHVLVTCGSRGACWCGTTGVRWFPAPKVKAIDTVGAGDCFSGAFAAAFAEGKPIEQAIRFAVAAASLSVTRVGAQPSMPCRREVLKTLGNEW
jgi:ribokinase